jgi:HTH-type transcriptional regulator/antitoxin HigA
LRRQALGFVQFDGFDPVDVLHYAIDELAHTQADLGKVLGSRARASKIPSRRRR